MLVDEEEDINKVSELFSYEHFYVLYCRYFELDEDRDGRIGRDELIRYSDHALSDEVVDRIFSHGHRVIPGGNMDQITYIDFVYFMLSEEDKESEMGIRYWFDILDLDGVGMVHEDVLKYFFSYQQKRLKLLEQEYPSFEKIIGQLLDLLQLKSLPITFVFLNVIVIHVIFYHRLPHLLSHREQAKTLFDILFNLNKFIMFEGRDPFFEKQKREDPFNSDWERLILDVDIF